MQSEGGMNGKRGRGKKGKEKAKFASEGS